MTIPAARTSTAPVTAPPPVAAEKVERRRAALAAAALSTLAEYGYARTSLREIAQMSGFSHGVFHYYFRDKAALMAYCVREYKAACVRQYDALGSGLTDPEQLRAALADALAASARDDTAMHRLWYDLRNQSLFDSDFAAEVAAVDSSLEHLIWRLVTRYAALSTAAVALPSGTVYALLDGLFAQALLGLHTGRADAVPALRDAVWQLLPRLITDVSPV